MKINEGVCNLIIEEIRIVYDDWKLYKYSYKLVNVYIEFEFDIKEIFIYMCINLC